MAAPAACPACIVGIGSIPAAGSLFFGSPTRREAVKLTPFGSTPELGLREGERTICDAAKENCWERGPPERTKILALRDRSAAVAVEWWHGISDVVLATHP
ncbi:hypothetical protein L210DRAFT_985682 [Boletus edulis BED1]|uniref:Uncharacterized protein n=1 Tax=Boletus edulis BED1 TaxID=1328754 RepID=A0AAD4G8N1_BOLED|nr:hypothetical protein L210DRAFT_985682 [Boletus edulis BED1]